MILMVRRGRKKREGFSKRRVKSAHRGKESTAALRKGYGRGGLDLGAGEEEG